MARKPTGGKPGRPSKADLAARARSRADATGESLVEAAAAVGVGASTAYRAPVARPGVAKAPAPPVAVEPPAPPPTIAEGAPVDRLRAYAAHDSQALVVLEQLLAPPPALGADLGGTAREMLAQLWADYRAALGTSKRNPAAGRILDALRELRQHFPPPAPAPAPDVVLEELLRLDGEVLRRIEEHATEPITSGEIH